MQLINEIILPISNLNHKIRKMYRPKLQQCIKSAAISRIILMYLMTDKQAQLFCATDVLNKDIKPKSTESFKNYKPRCDLHVRRQ
jgi:hypothetical protein